MGGRKNSIRQNTQRECGTKQFNGPQGAGGAAHKAAVWWYTETHAEHAFWAGCVSVTARGWARQRCHQRCKVGGASPLQRRGEDGGLARRGRRRRGRCLLRRPSQRLEQQRQHLLLPLRLRAAIGWLGQRRSRLLLLLRHGGRRHRAGALLPVRQAKGGGQQVSGARHRRRRRGGWLWGAAHSRQERHCRLQQALLRLPRRKAVPVRLRRLLLRLLRLLRLLAAQQGKQRACLA